MPCLIAILAISLPRVLLVLIWLFSDWTSMAFRTWFWPLLGFFFFPYTTLGYMWAANATNHQIDGAWVFLIVLGVLLDLGVIGSTGRRRRRRRDR
ncbi:MAG TPA: hypothetical protein VK797_01625 [Tepidisphaeraceae bacterium]|nr:hypothetical protein [Tepidisphaeraceae bacterium]